MIFITILFNWFALDYFGVFVFNCIVWLLIISMNIWTQYNLANNIESKGSVILNIFLLSVIYLFPSNLFVLMDPFLLLACARFTP